MIWSLLLQMTGGMGGWWSFAFLGPFVALFVMGAIVYLLWNTLDGQQSSSGGPAGRDDAMEVLRRRYARGEIDEDTFEERAQSLGEQ